MENNNKVETTAERAVVQVSPTPDQFIPEDERALVEVNSNQVLDNNKKPIAEKVQTFADNVPDDEREEQIVLREEFAPAKQMGYLSSASGMANIKNVLDNCLYASIHVDKDDNRYIVFCQQYSTGEFSPRIQVAQSDLFFAASNNFRPAGIAVPLLKNRLSKFLANITADYFGKFSGDELLNIIDILNALLAVRQSLPVYQDRGVDETPELFYQMVVDAFRKRFETIKDFFIHKAYYVLGDNELHWLAEDMEMSKAKLLEKLKNYGFLYLTPSSKGFQTKVRYDEKNSDWCYCIYKMEYIGSLNQNPK